MKIPTMANIVYRQMLAPRELSQQIPAPGQKLECKSPRLGQIFGANPRGCAGGMVMAKIDSCITFFDGGVGDLMQTVMSMVVYWGKNLVQLGQDYAAKLTNAIMA